MKKYYAVLIILLVSGCRLDWTATTDHVQPLVDVKAKCTNISLEQYPVNNKEVFYHRRSSEEDDCINPIICGFPFSSFTESEMIDVNADLRRKAFYACMLKEGWRAQRNFIFKAKINK